TILGAEDLLARRHLAPARLDVVLLGAVVVARRGRLVQAGVDRPAVGVILALVVDVLDAGARQPGGRVAHGLGEGDQLDLAGAVVLDVPAGVQLERPVGPVRLAGGAAGRGRGEPAVARGVLAQAPFVLQPAA